MRHQPDELRTLECLDLHMGHANHPPNSTISPPRGPARMMRTAVSCCSSRPMALHRMMGNRSADVEPVRPHIVPPNTRCSMLRVCPTKGSGACRGNMPRLTHGMNAPLMPPTDHCLAPLLIDPLAQGSRRPGRARPFEANASIIAALIARPSVGARTINMPVNTHLRALPAPIRRPRHLKESFLYHFGDFIERRSQDLTQRGG